MNQMNLNEPALDNMQFGNVGNNFIRSTSFSQQPMVCITCPWHVFFYIFYLVPVPVSTFYAKCVVRSQRYSFKKCTHLRTTCVSWQSSNCNKSSWDVEMLSPLMLSSKAVLLRVCNLPTQFSAVFIMWQSSPLACLQCCNAVTWRVNNVATHSPGAFTMWQRAYLARLQCGNAPTWRVHNVAKQLPGVITMCNAVTWRVHNVAKQLPGVFTMWQSRHLAWSQCGNAVPSRVAGDAVEPVGVVGQRPVAATAVLTEPLWLASQQS